MNSPPLLFVDCAEFTLLHAGAALDTLLRINDVRVLDRADDGVVGAVPCAQGTALTLIRINVVGEECFTYAGRAAFLLNMGLVFVTEEPQGGKHRVGSRLSKSAEGIVLNVIAELLQFVQIFHGSLTLGDLGQDLQHTSGTDAAGSTFAAGLLHRKLQEELGNIYQIGRAHV